MKTLGKMAILAAGGLIAVGSPAFADVKAGVDAWARGDYDAAVREWREPAARGDADAQFNMAQAYRLGRGVEADEAQAEMFYAKAAAQGHIKAADNYGLLLFQAGRREEAMPYVQAAADRGDPRAQYLLGIAHFNGDLVPKDWVRAYALLTLANATGLPQARPAIQQMDDFIPLKDRQSAQVLAKQIERDATANRAQQLASADLAAGDAAPRSPNTPAPQQAAAVPAPTLPPRGAARVPEPMASVSVPPSIAAARAAIAEAARATGTKSPAGAGADFTRANSAPTVAEAPPAPARPDRAPVVRQASTPDATAPQAASATPASAEGPWRVQLGAFGVDGNAQKLWRQVSARPPLAGKQRFLVPAGRLTKLQAGGFASRSAAQNACDLLKRNGQACIVTR